MPVDLRNHDSSQDVGIDPGTNKAKLIKFLYSQPHLGYKPAEIHDQLDIPKGSVTTTLLRLHEAGQIGKTTDGYYHALETRDDLRRFASGLVQVESLVARYADDELSPDDVAAQPDEHGAVVELRTDSRTEADVDAELLALESDIDSDTDREQE